MSNRRNAGARSHARAAPSEVLLRGLSLLEALNARTVSSVEHLALETRLPKATIVRMLSQLASKNYVVRLPARRGYQLGERVLSLSAGYRSRDAIVDVARAHLDHFTAEHKWPVAIATLDGDAMRNRAGTLADSPFASHLDQRRMARRVPILVSATGLVYLAFCPELERDTILRLLKTSHRRDDRLAKHDERVAELLRAIREQGFAPSPVLRGDPVRGFAIPIMVGERVLACITLRYFGRALTQQQALKRFLGPLRSTADAIAREYAEP